MISLSMILTIIAIVIVFAILFKLLGLISAVLKIPAPWGQILYWVIVLIVVIYLLGMFDIVQPVIK